MKLKILLLLLISAFFVSPIRQVNAQIPRMFSYQGSLNDNMGKPVNGNHTVTFNLYSAQTGGTSLFTEMQTVTSVNGIFSANIGSTVPIPASVQFDNKYYLGISIDGGAELSPRTAIVASPYTLNAANAGHAHISDTAGNANYSEIANGLTADAGGAVRSINNQQGDLTFAGEGEVKITSLGGVISIGIPPLTLPLPYTATGTNGISPLFTVQNNGLNGAAIKAVDFSGGSGIGNVSNATIWGDAGAGYNGIVGYSNGGTAFYAGVLGHGVGPATGVAAIGDIGDGLTSTSNTGRAGSFQIFNPANMANALEASTSGSGSAILGSSLADSTNGIHGISYGQNYTSGVFGEATSTTPGTSAQVGPSGVLGKADGGSMWSAGIRGINPSANVNGYGVIGYQAGGGTGVYGESPIGNGVYGKVTDATAPAYGVLGTSASVNGAGVKASYNGAGVGNALVVDNGAIKVSGTNKAAFVKTISTAADLFPGSAIRVEIDNPVCNNDPTCMIYVNYVINNLALVTGGFTKQTPGLFYDAARGKWSIISLNNQSFTNFPFSFNILVVKQ